MHRAYVFPVSVHRSDIDESALPSAIPVTVGSPHHELMSASDSGRLRCRGCLYAVTVVHIPAESSFADHFRHVPEAPEDCIYRVNWNWPEDGTAPSSRREEDPGKLIERLLLRELQQSLGSRHNAVRITAGEGRLPSVRVEGLDGRPLLVIRALTPGDKVLFDRPFSGTLDGEQTLFFVADWHLSKMDATFFNRNVLHRRPIIAVSVARPTHDRDRFDIRAQLPGLGAVSEPIAELDLTWVDYKRIFGSEREGEFLFIQRAHREALAFIRETLEKVQAPMAKLLRLFAKRLLVDGAEAHLAVFQTDKTQARGFFRSSGWATQEWLLDWNEFKLVANQEPSVLTPQQPLLNRYFQEFCQGYLDDLWTEKEDLKARVAALETTCAELREELSLERGTSQELREKLEAAAEAYRQLDQALEALRKDLATERAKSDALHRQLDSARAQKAELSRQLSRPIRYAFRKKLGIPV